MEFGEGQPQMVPGVGAVGLRCGGSLPAHPTPRWASCSPTLFLFPLPSLFTSTPTRILPSPQLIPLSLLCSHPQDTLGGRFDATQAFVGELSQFNIWDRVLRAQEIIGIANCSTNMAGNIIPWVDNNVDVFGGASKWPVETCEERLLDL